MNEELAEGVYAGSGDCYSFNITKVQVPELGRNNYKFQINGRHEAADGHHSTMRTVAVDFNQPVHYISSLATECSGDNTSCLILTYISGNGSYHNNAIDNIGLGDLVVESREGLEAIRVYSTYCNESCNQH